MTFVYESKAGAYLYVMGGAQNDFANVWDDVQRSKIAGDGSLGAFETISHITGGLAGAALGIIGNSRSAVLFADTGAILSSGVVAVHLSTAPRPLLTLAWSRRKPRHYGQVTLRSRRRLRLSGVWWFSSRASEI